MDDGVFFGVELAPGVLLFSGGVTGDAAAELQVTNPGTMRAAFKVLVTTPERYSVVPCKSVLEVGATATIQIRMRRLGLPHGRGCVDKFLVKSVGLAPREQRVHDALFDHATTSRKIWEARVDAWVEDALTEETSVASLGSPISVTRSSSIFTFTDPKILECHSFATPRFLPGSEVRSIFASPCVSSDETTSSPLRSTRDIQQRVKRLERRLQELEDQQTSVDRSRGAKRPRRWGVVWGMVACYAAGVASGCAIKARRVGSFVV